jgi:hypothetical protein
VGDRWTERFVSDTPRLRAHPPAEPIPGRCDACGGADVECVSHDAAGCNTGTYELTEWRCRACGRFTSEEQTYDS